MAIEITDISPILKKIFAGNKVAHLVQKKTPLLDIIKTNVGVEVMNNNIYISSRTGRHSGIYYVAEGTQPRTGKSTYALPVAPIKFMFGTVEFTDQALSAADGSKKSVENILNLEIGAAMADAAKEANRVFHGAGTGKLCLANGAGVSSTTVTVDNCPSEGSSGDHTKYIIAGGYVKIGSNSAALVSSVDSTTQFTIASALSWSDNDVITRADAAEAMGLAGIIDDGDNVSTIQGITRSGNPRFVAQVEDTAEALSEQDMILKLLQARKYSGKSPSEHVLFMGTTMYMAYGSLLLSQKRSTDPKPVLSGGWRGLEFMDGVAVIHDDDTWEGYVQGVHVPSLTIGQSSEAMKWLPAYDNGGILIRSGSDRSKWEGTFKWYHNLVGLQFNPHFRLSQKTG